MTEVSSEKSINVWLIEDNETYRTTVFGILSSYPGIHCHLDFDSCEPALKRLEKKLGTLPDVILLDLGLPGMGGLDAIPKFREAAPDCNILVITVFDDKPKVFSAIQAGATGYILKSSKPEEIVSAIGQVASGGSPLSPQVATYFLNAFKSSNATDSADLLNDHESNVLSHIADGLTRKEVGGIMNISHHTVDYHIRKIYQKLHVNTMSGAIAQASKKGII